MKNRALEIGILLASMSAVLIAGGCSKAHDEAAEAPPPANVVSAADPGLFTVDHPEQFPLAAATERSTTSELVVTGTVAPDIARNVPVVSLASGRIVSIHARLGDRVNKGQLLLRVQSSDVAGAFSDYRKAVNDERLARFQFERAKILYEKGAIAKSALETFANAEEDAQVVLETTAESRDSERT